MKRILLTCLAIFVFQFSNSQSSFSIEIGDEDNALVTMPIFLESGNYSVWSSSYSSNDIELSSTSDLSSLSFFVADPSYLDVNHINVYIKVSESTTFSNDICNVHENAKDSYLNSIGTYDQEDSYHLVYSGPYVGAGESGWQEIIFDRGIKVDSSHNISVVVEKENYSLEGEMPSFLCFETQSGASKMNVDDYSNCSLSTSDSYKPMVKFTFNGTTNSRSYSNATIINSATVNLPTQNTIYSVNDGTSTFYDDGGSVGGYAAFTNSVVSFRPTTAGRRMKFTLNSFYTEASQFGDFMIIYDGESVDPNKVLDILEGSVLSTTYTATDPSGALTILYNSDGLIDASGWDFTVVCEAISNCNSNLSTASISPATDDYSNTPINISVSLTGNDEFVQWEQSVNGDPYEAISQAANFTLSGLNTTTSFKAKCKRPFCDMTVFSAPNAEYYYTTSVTYTTSNNYFINDNVLVGDRYCQAIGNDANLGRVSSKPKATMAALLASIGSLKGGDTLFVDVGNYSESMSGFSVVYNAGLPVVVQGAGKNYTYISNSSSSTNTIELFNVNDIELSELNISSTSATHEALKIGSATDIIVSRCEMSNSVGNAVYLYNSSVELTSNSFGGSTTSDLLRLSNENDGNTYEISKNVFTGGSTALVINSMNEGTTTNINRNYFCTSSTGVKLLTDINLSQNNVVNIYNNSFYIENYCIELVHSSTDADFKVYNLVHLKNNILSFYGSGGYSIKTSTSNGLSPFLFDAMASNDYYSYQSSTNIFSTSTTTFGYSSVNSIDLGAENVNPQFTCLTNCNLSLGVSSTILNSGFSLDFTDGIGGESWSVHPFGAGQLSSLPNQYYALGKSKNNGMACLDGTSLKFTYKSEYASSSGQFMKYTVYNDNNTAVLASGGIGAPVISLKYGMGQYTLDVSQATGSLGDYNILVVENAKGEKSYLRFENLECGCAN
ncbi:MAG: hypothetical protein KAG64_04530 [Bacteroidales bacterium]|nr:hypothetical protein [Bacteroidales bacterium]